MVYTEDRDKRHMVKANSVLEGEFQALIIAMQHVWIHGHRKIIFEDASKELVDKFLSTLVCTIGY